MNLIKRFRPALGVLLLALSFATTMADSKTAQVSAEVAGPWEGVYVVRGRVFEIKLALVSEGGGLAPVNELLGRVPPLTRDQFGRAWDPNQAMGTPVTFKFSYEEIRYNQMREVKQFLVAKGEGTYSGVYDPDARLLYLKKPEVRPARDPAPDFAALRVLVSLTAAQLTGSTSHWSWDGNSFLFLGRSGTAARLAGIYKNVGGMQRETFAPKPRGPSAAMLKKWVGDRKSSMGLSMGEIFQLFDDARFQACFGKTFDQMTRADLDGVRGAIFVNENQQDAAKVVAEVNWVVDFFTVHRYREWLNYYYLYRGYRRWHGETIAAIKANPPATDRNFEDEMLAAEMNWYETLDLVLGPEYFAAIRESRPAMSGPRLVRGIDTLAKLQPVDYSVGQLLNWRAIFSTALAVAPPEYTAKAELLAEQALSRKVAQLKEEGSRIVGSFPAGISAIKQGVAFYRVLEQLKGRSDFAEAFRAQEALLIARRPGDFREGWAAMSDEARRWTSIEAGAAGIGSWVGLPSDLEIPLVRQLLRDIEELPLHSQHAKVKSGWTTAFAFFAVVLHGREMATAPYGWEADGTPKRYPGPGDKVETSAEAADRLAAYGIIMAGAAALDSALEAEEKATRKRMIEAALPKL